MQSFRQIRSIRPEGFVCHHLIPTKVLEMQTLSGAFASARSAGFDPNDFSTNGMFLPCLETNAVAFKLPLHRGPHNDYNFLVALRISAMAHLKPAELCLQLKILQNTLKIGLRNYSILVDPVVRDPLRSTLDFRKIDGAIDLLWAATEPKN